MKTKPPLLPEKQYYKNIDITKYDAPSLKYVQVKNIDFDSFEARAGIIQAKDENGCFIDDFYISVGVTFRVKDEA